MDKQEAAILLTRKLSEYRALSYAQILARIDSSDHYEVTGASGVEYQIDVQFFWDDKLNGDIRVSGAIDDGGWRAFVPLCDSFLLSSDGRFVGEDGS